MNRAKTMLYVSLGLGIHDRRFIESAQESGWVVTTLRCDGKNNVAWIGVNSNTWIGNRELISSINHNEFKSEFRRIVNTVKPNLIQIGPLSTAAAVLDENLGVPILAVSWAQDLLYDIHESDWSKQVAIFAIQMSKHLLTDCSTVHDVAISLGALDASISVVPWGVDLEKFYFSQRKPKVDIPTIVSLRMLERIYSVSTLLEAARDMKSLKSSEQFRIVIGGSGSQDGVLKDLAANYGLSNSTDFIGSIPESNLPLELLSYSLYVSTSPIDGSSISMLQAMALGLPCIVTDIPSNREWIDHGSNGLLYESQNSRALAELLIDITNEPRKIDSLARNARATVEARANWRTGRRLLSKIYDQVAFE